MTGISRRHFGAGLTTLGLMMAAGTGHGEIRASETRASETQGGDAGACGGLPDWVAPLRADLLAMAVDLTARLKGWDGPDRVVTPEAFGYDGTGLATRAIQAAIDAAAAQGGGTVRLSQGDYVSGTIDLRSHIRLEIMKGARLLGSLDLKDYPERKARRLTVQDTNMGMNQSLIFAEGCTDIALSGEGEINGRGTKANFPGEETIHGTPGRPFVIRVIDCERVHVHGLTMKDSPCWMQNYLNCEDVLIEHLTVENQSNFNNDGLDIDGCRRVIVRHNHISAGDDALCFKGASQRTGEHILIENNTFFSSCNAIKFGTDSQGNFRNILIRNCLIGGVSEEMRRVKNVNADSAFSWESVDGGVVENILATDIKIVRAWSPFFLRLEKRGRVKPGDAPAYLGTIRRIVFEKISGEDNGPRGSYFLGIPEKRINDIVLHDIDLKSRVTQKPVLREDQIGEMYGVYPDAHMIDDMGDAPAYGLWARHVDNLTLVNYRVTPDGNDPRPFLLLKTETSGVCVA